jgi:hypothetical protein
MHSSVLSPHEILGLKVFGGICCGLEDPPCITGNRFAEAELSALLANFGLVPGSPWQSCGVFENTFKISPGLRKGWTYLWNNNGCRGKVCHHFWVGCFRNAAEPGHFECIGWVKSSEFEVCSSKRAGVRGSEDLVSKRQKIAKRKKAEASAASATASTAKTKRKTATADQVTRSTNRYSSPVPPPLPELPVPTRSLFPVFTLSDVPLNPNSSYQPVQRGSAGEVGVGGIGQPDASMWSGFNQFFSSTAVRSFWLLHVPRVRHGRHNVAITGT